MTKYQRIHLRLPTKSNQLDKLLKTLKIPFLTHYYNEFKGREFFGPHTPPPLPLCPSLHLNLRGVLILPFEYD